ncbi:hypothetical protein EDC04DRAFT_238172 [Pisolithus marmoratus]|nr:hypothetical protein EDC04DRAFT_238172 [Pisolithus marmoratus]
MSDAFDVIPLDIVCYSTYIIGRSLGQARSVTSTKVAHTHDAIPRINLYGIDVAIKEVLPSSSYNIAKYFEREWRLMKESCRPNVVLYLGLSRAPPLDGRIFVVSEYIENVYL